MRSIPNLLGDFTNLREGLTTESAVLQFSFFLGKQSSEKYWQLIPSLRQLSNLLGDSTNLREGLVLSTPKLKIAAKNRRSFIKIFKLQGCTFRPRRIHKGQNTGLRIWCDCPLNLKSCILCLIFTINVNSPCSLRATSIPRLLFHSSQSLPIRNCSSPQESTPHTLRSTPFYSNKLYSVMYRLHYSTLYITPFSSLSLLQNIRFETKQIKKTKYSLNSLFAFIRPCPCPC